MNVLVVQPKNSDACSWFRGGGPWSQMNRLGFVVRFANNETQWEDLAQNDILFSLRPHNQKHLQLMRTAKWHGLKVWVDYDDNLFQVPPENPMALSYNSPVVKKAMAQCIEVADLVTVSTDVLRDQWRNHFPKLNPNKFQTIKNALDPRIVHRRQAVKRAKVPIVFWRGTATHHKDLLMVEDALVSVANDNPESPFLFAGVQPWFSERIKKCSMLEAMTLFNYFDVLGAITVDAGIVPLVDHAFNRAKSDIAAMEHAVAGAIPIVPAWEEWQAPGLRRFGNVQEFQAQLQEVLAMSVEDRERDSSEILRFYQQERGLDKANAQRAKLANTLLHGGFECS